MSVLVIVTLAELFLGVWNRPPASLGELALREAVRRQSAPEAVRSLTDADVGPPPARAPRPAKLPAAAAGDTPTSREKPPAAVTQKDEAWWRARMAQARLALERDTLLVKALESRAAVLTRDVANRDDPAQRAMLIAERVRVLKEIDLLKQQVIADTEAIAAIEDEARREGVPPGWIRSD